MKIAFLDDGIYAFAMNSPSAPGGAERQQWLVARALASRGFTVVVGIRRTLKLGERHTIDGVEFVGIGLTQILKAWSQFFRSESPDWWYWRTADHIWGLGVVLAKLMGIKIIFAAAFDTDLQPRHALSRRRVWWPLYAVGLALADKIFLQHEGQFSSMFPLWKRKACVVSNIVAIPATIKKHHEREPYVAWIGDLRYHKRPDILIEIVKKLPQIRFVVCGGLSNHRSPTNFSVSLADSMRSISNIVYLGRVPPQKTLDVIAGAGVLLSTSEAEGFPNVFLEAWAHGTPVVTLKIDPGGVLKRFGLGIVSDTWARALEDTAHLMSHPRHREEIGERARRYVEEKHTEAGLIKAIEDVITEVPKSKIGNKPSLTQEPKVL